MNLHTIVISKNNQLKILRLRVNVKQNGLSSGNYVKIESVANIAKLIWIAKRDARVKAAREMPRPCAAGVTQAQLTHQVSKNILTRALRGGHIIVK